MAVDEMVMIDGFGFSSGVVRRSSAMGRAEIGGKFKTNGVKDIEFNLNVPKGNMVKVSSKSKYVKLLIFNNSISRLTILNTF